MTQKSPRIFVVDDAPLIASSIADILRLSGLSATSFTDPLEALAAASPDFLIADIYMPGLSGIELATRLKLMCLDCDILLFSGHPFAANLVDEAHHRGQSFKFLYKPIPPLQLIRKVSATEDFRQTALISMR
jgi:FixJ family two-component response regulator